MSLQYDYQSRKARFSTDPGRLDRKITLLSPFITRDDAGGFSTLWIAFATVWASQRFESSRRMYAGEEKRNEEFLVYRIRHRTAVANQWRIRHGDDIFEITGIEPLGRNHLLDLTVRGIDQSVGNTISALLFESGDVALLESGSIFSLEGAN